MRKTYSALLNPEIKPVSISFSLLAAFNTSIIPFLFYSLGLSYTRGSWLLSRLTGPSLLVSCDKWHSSQPLNVGVPGLVLCLPLELRAPKFIPFFCIPDSYLMFPQHLSWMLESHLIFKLRSWFWLSSLTPPQQFKTSKKPCSISVFSILERCTIIHLVYSAQHLWNQSWCHSFSQIPYPIYKQVQLALLSKYIESNNFSPSLTVQTTIISFPPGMLQ